MAEQPPAFVVVDRRKFTAEGEVRERTPEEIGEERPAPAPVAEEPKEPAREPETAKVVTMPLREPEPDPTAGADDLLEEDLAGALEATGTDDDGIEWSPEDAALQPPARSAEETAAQEAAYRENSRSLDALLAQSNPGMQQPGAISFEHVVQSFYLSAVMAMGAGTQPGEKPRIDILAARQSIDMLTVLEDKTQGNLSPEEQQLIQGITFELRMMFVELTNAIGKQAHQPPPGGLR